MSAAAVCDAQGIVDFYDSNDVPEGLLVVFHAPSMRRARAVASAVCRHAWDGKTLLVPGIPEAETEADGLEALRKFRAWLAEGTRRGVTL